MSDRLPSAGTRSDSSGNPEKNTHSLRPEPSTAALEAELAAAKQQSDGWHSRTVEADAALLMLRKAALKVVESHGGAAEVAELDSVLVRQGWTH